MARTNIFNNLGMPVTNFKGDTKLLFLLVDLPNAPCKRTNEEIEELFFATGGANDYLKTTSNNKCSISRLTTTGTEANGVIRVRLDSSEYLPPSKVQELIKNTLIENTSKINWSELDRNKDKIINSPFVSDGFPVYENEFSIVILYSANSGELGRTGCYQFKSDVVINNIELAHFTFMVLENTKGNNYVHKEIVCHELNHLFAMQDAYLEDARPLTGALSSMSSSYVSPQYDWTADQITRAGSGVTYPDILHRIKNGWAIAEEITTFPFTGKLEQHKAYTLKISETENYLIEYRPYDNYTRNVISGTFVHVISNALVLIWKINREIMTPSFQFSFNIYTDKDRNPIRTLNIISENGNEDNTNNGKCFFTVGDTDRNFKKVKVSVSNGNITLNKIDSNGNINNNLPLDNYPPINMPLPDINGENYFEGNKFVATVKYWEEYLDDININCVDITKKDEPVIAIKNTSKNNKTYTFDMSSLPLGKYTCFLSRHNLTDNISNIIGYWYEKTDGEVSPPEDVLVSSVTLNKKSDTINIGDSFYLYSTVLPSNASNKTLNWSSSNNRIVTVIDGTITGISSGTCTITCSSTDGSNKSDTCVVTVCEVVTPPEDILITNITLNKNSNTVNIGDNFTLTATISPNNATNKSINWSSSNTNIATVTNGYVTTKNKGVCVITCTSTDGSNKSATCNVSVNEIVTNKYLTSNLCTLAINRGGI